MYFSVFCNTWMALAYLATLFVQSPENPWFWVTLAAAGTLLFPIYFIFPRNRKAKLLVQFLCLLALIYPAAFLPEIFSDFGVLLMFAIVHFVIYILLLYGTIAWLIRGGRQEAMENNELLDSIDF